jgi:hypothetical protein
VSGLGFTCSYTKLRDVERDSPCGRPATRRARGAPKCMGHWAAGHLMETLGGTEHARKTWLWASGFLLCYAMWGAWAWSSSYNYYWGLTWSLAVFSVGLLLVTGPEHPLGGWLTLLSAVVIARSLLANGAACLKINPLAGIVVPNGSGLDILGGLVDLATGVIFFSSFVGFLFFYWTDDHKELRFWTGLNLPLAILALPCVVVVSVITHGLYLSGRPWIAVVYLAAFVARGPERFKQLAKHLRV